MRGHGMDSSGSALHNWQHDTEPAAVKCRGILEWLSSYPLLEKILANNQLDALFSCIYLFTSSIYMFRASQCSSSGERIVL